MATPGVATDRLADGVVDIYVAAERRLIALIASKVQQGLEAPDWAERQLATVVEYRRQAERIMAGAAGDASRAAGDAVRTAYLRGQTDAVAEIAEALRVPTTQTVGTVDTHAITRLAQEAQALAAAPASGAVNTATAAYQQVTNAALSVTVTGAASRQQAAQEALNRFADRGITGFLDRAGRSWRLTSYVEMATRTQLMNATLQGHTDRLQQHGQDLVIVSDHPQECALCRPYEGRVLSLSGSVSGAISAPNPITDTPVAVQVDGSLDQARAAGLFHPNAILGDQNVTMLGDVKNAVRAWYDGPSVNLTTANGVRLTVSPGHPVLTANGWRRADALREGDTLFRSVSREVMVVGHQEFHDGESSTEDVFQTLSAVGSRAGISAAADDLHGDGVFVQGEVDVVVPHRSLLTVGDASPVEDAGEHLFIGAGMELHTLPSLSSGDLYGHAVGCPVGRTLAHVHADAMQASQDRPVADAEDPSEVLGGLPCHVAADELVHVERDRFQGWAYDFQTGTGAYAANTLIVHNCRHSYTAYLPGVTDTSFGETADPAGDRDRQQLRYLERGVRSWKRREAAALTPAARKSAKAKTREWQGRIREHVKTTTAKRQAHRERLTAR